MNDNNIIFLVSQPRSGSTFLQAVLSNNEKVQTVSEPWVALPFLSIMKDGATTAIYNHNLCIEAIKSFTEKIGSSCWDEALRLALKSLYSNLDGHSTKFVLDKTPRYYEILAELEKLFPQAYFVILRRNPLAVLNSIIETWPGKRPLRKLLKYNRDILVAPGLIQDFVNSNLENKQIKIVDYEELVENPEGNVKDLYEWLGIQFNNDMLDYGRNKSYKGPMGDPNVGNFTVPSSERVNLWREKLDDKNWKGFFLSYASFLGEDVMAKYELCYNHTMTRKFKYFLNKTRISDEMKGCSLKLHLKEYFKDNILYRKW